MYRRDFPETTRIIQEEPQILKDHDDNLLPKSFEVDCVGIWLNWISVWFVSVISNFQCC